MIPVSQGGGGGPITDTRINSGVAGAGEVLTADGAGGASWQAPGAVAAEILVKSVNIPVTVDPAARDIIIYEPPAAPIPANMRLIEVTYMPTSNPGGGGNAKLRTGAGNTGDIMSDSISSASLVEPISAHTNASRLLTAIDSLYMYQSAGDMFVGDITLIFAKV